MPLGHRSEYGFGQQNVQASVKADSCSTRVPMGSGGGAGGISYPSLLLRLGQS